jgi:hypothetical protein
MLFLPLVAYNKLCMQLCDRAFYVTILAVPSTCAFLSRPPVLPPKMGDGVSGLSVGGTNTFSSTTGAAAASARTCTFLETRLTDLHKRADLVMVLRGAATLPEAAALQTGAVSAILPGTFGWSVSAVNKEHIVDKEYLAIAQKGFGTCVVLLN